MKIVYFTHSLASCWNHGNAHFIRGVLRELKHRGHEVVALEPASGWSRENLLADHGTAPFERFATAFPELTTRLYGEQPPVEALLRGADLVIVHEWTERCLVAAIGAVRRRGGRFLLFFHDTHHRAVSEPSSIRAFDLSGYDGVLAFGEALAEVYRRWGWGRRAYVWHEAADVRLFRPAALDDEDREGLVWIGNWGDGERSAELAEFLLTPAHDLDVPLDVHGVRYPPEALAALDEYGARYHGWVANMDVPDIYARHRATVHVPRRFYAEALPGIPTIRVFEALACGIPLVCAPWDDAEGLFNPGHDYLLARNGNEMREHLKALMSEAGLRRSLTQGGLRTILARHTCAHRVDELLAIAHALRQPAEGAA